MTQLALGSGETTHKKRPISLFDTAILARAIADSFKKLNPRILFRNPVMFVAEVVAALTTVILARDLVSTAVRSLSRRSVWSSSRSLSKD
jgi:high-affinity K+ transport system ATPase subunit B